MADPSHPKKAATQAGNCRWGCLPVLPHSSAPTSKSFGAGFALSAEWCVLRVTEPGRRPAWAQKQNHMARGSGVSGAQSMILREALAGGEVVGTLLSGEWHGQRRASTVPTESPPRDPFAQV